MMPDQPSPEPDWQIDDHRIAYPEALAAMEERVTRIRDGSARELVWLLEHPPIYTAGTSAREADLLVPDRFPVYRTGRGGQFIYHGPGQRIIYVMLNLAQRRQDIRCYVHALEAWAVRTLSEFNVQAFRREGRVGLWVRKDSRFRQGREYKIAAIGVRIRRWVTMHGLALNVSPDLTHFSGIVPCGIREHGVTSLEDLGITASMRDVDMALQSTFDGSFGPGTLMGRTDGHE